MLIYTDYVRIMSEFYTSCEEVFRIFIQSCFLYAFLKNTNAYVFCSTKWTWEASEMRKQVARKHLNTKTLTSNWHKQSILKIFFLKFEIWEHQNQENAIIKHIKSYRFLLDCSPASTSSFVSISFTFSTFSFFLLLFSQIFWLFRKGKRL